MQEAKIDKPQSASMQYSVDSNPTYDLHLQDMNASVPRKPPLNYPESPVASSFPVPEPQPSEQSEGRYEMAEYEMSNEHTESPVYHTID